MSKPNEPKITLPQQGQRFKSEDYILTFKGQDEFENLKFCVALAHDYFYVTQSDNAFLSEIENQTLIPI
jgi:hypothetical protein